MYSEIKPDSRLSSIVENFWIIDTTNYSSPVETEVLPDGCFDIVIYTDQNGENNVLLTGIWDRPIKVSTPPDSLIAGIRFFPGAIDFIINMSLTQLKNISMPLETEKIKTPPGLTLDILYQSNDPKDIIEYIEAFLIILLESESERPNDILQKLLELSATESVSEISARIGISERHLTRKLNEMFGIRTKSYLNILRFIKAKELLLSQSKTPLSHIAINAGYYDQAHLTREFKKYSGKTPKQFISEYV